MSSEFVIFFTSEGRVRPDRTRLDSGVRPVAFGDNDLGHSRRRTDFRYLAYVKDICALYAFYAISIPHKYPPSTTDI